MATATACGSSWERTGVLPRERLAGKVLLARARRFVQRAHEIIRGSDAIRRILAEQPHNDRDQQRGSSAPPPLDRFGQLRGVGGEQLLSAPALEWRTSAQHLVR